MAYIKQMKHYITYIITALAAMLVSCSDSDSFRIHGELTDGSNINLRVVYYTNSAVHTGITASNAGKFMYEGFATKPALIEIYDNDYRLLGRLVATNGQDIDIKIDRSNIYRNTIKGNPVSEALSATLTARADELQSSSIAGRNGIIAAAIGADPAAPEAYMLLITEYSVSGYERQADSLLALIPIEARIEGISAGFEAMLQRVAEGIACDTVAPLPYMISGGTIHMFSPSATPLSLIVFSDSRDGRDSVLAAVRSLASRRSKRQFDILDLNLDQDTTVWRRNVRNDSATWTQGWVAGGISAQAVDRLGIPRLPYFVLIDSAGVALWRGNSASQAENQTIKHIDKL